MPESIDQVLVQQYQSTMRLLSQQKISKLEETTIPPVRMEGEYLFWERIGPSEAIDIPTRHADTPNIEVDHSRRRVSATPKVWATILDIADAKRMMADPKSPYTETAVRALARAKDTIIINALGGSAWTGKQGTTEVPLPSSQKIVHGSTGLTISKILTVIERFGLADVDPDVERYIVAAPQQRTNLLNTTEVTSSDYNTIKALVNGDIDTFLGFKFIWSTRLPIAGGIRLCYAYTKEAIGFGVLEEVNTRVSELPTKNYSWQVYARMDMGATRIEDEQVIEIACQES